MAGASPTENDRSGIEVDKEIGGARLSPGFLFSPSFEMYAGLTRERLEEPEVDTVESDDDEG